MILERVAAAARSFLFVLITSGNMMNRLFIFTALTALAGCGGGTSGVPVYPVSGTVTLFGAPLGGATIAFAPTGEQPTAIGTTDPQGKFSLTTYNFGDGAAEGSYKVVVTKTATASGSSDPTIDGNDHEAAEAALNVDHGAQAANSAEMVPPQYTSAGQSPLTADVKSSGENTFTFDLQ